MRLAYVAIIAAFAAASTPAWAQVHAGDIILTIDPGSIVTNNAVGPARVFTATFQSGDPPFTTSPGFDSLPGTFPSNSRNGFRILDALRRWDGVSFETISESGMRVGFSTLEAFTPEEGGTVEGFTLAVGSNGEWHKHLEYRLLPPAAQGVYLLTLQLFSTSGTIGDSEPFWMVFSNGADAGVVDDAAAWVRDHLESGSGAACDGDVNCDGNLDGFDVGAMEQAVGGDASDFCQPDPDFNHDGNLDGFDVMAVERVVGGGECD